VKAIRTDRRIKKIRSVIESRQTSLTVVLENIHDPHNVSAILRTCDAAGIPKVSLLYYIEKFPRIGKKSSASAFKWVERDKYKSVDKCYKSLKKEGFKVYASQVSDDSKDIYDLDFTGSTAIVLGNENRGISEEAANMADERFVIPMYGMVQSLNVSVSAAITIYEAVRQRQLRGMYKNSVLSKEHIKNEIKKWSEK
jgi:tRNA (guanosine-2'-O-)-methyltransferase